MELDLELTAGPKFTPRNVGKYVAKHAVTAVVAKAVKDALETFIPATQNYKIAELGGGLAGWYAGGKVEPYTDALVDEIANEIAKRKAAKAKHIA